MKMICIIVQNEDVRELLYELNKQGFTATRLSSSGGFLKKSNATLVVGTPSEKVSQVKQIVKDTCGTRKKISISSVEGLGGFVFPMEVETGGATMFVMDVEEYEKV